MTATRQLTVHNAQISTATVQVKTLTISGKQVTLAVFRQLREEPLITDDGYLNGVAWGVVNYHPDKCADAVEHMHIVWQRGSELLRSRVWLGFSRDALGGAVANRFLTACAYEVLADGAKWFDGSPLPDVYRATSYAPVERRRTFHVPDFPQVNFAAEATAAAKDAWDAYRSVEKAAKVFDRVSPELDQKYLETLDELRKQYEAIRMTASELHAKLQARASDEMERRNRHTAARKAIADLPQLFIAA